MKCLSLFSTPCFEEWEFYGRQSVPYTLLSGVPDMCMTVPFIISHVNIRTSFRAKQKQTLEFSTYSVYLTAQTLSLYSRFKLSHFHTRVMCVFCSFLESYSMYLLLSPKRMCKMDGVSAGIIQQWNHVITRKQT